MSDIEPLTPVSSTPLVRERRHYPGEKQQTPQQKKKKQPQPEPESDSPSSEVEQTTDKSVDIDEKGAKVTHIDEYAWLVEYMDVTTLLFIAIAIALILFVLLAVFVNSLSRSLRQSQAELKQLKQYTALQQKQLKELSHEFQTMTNAAFGVGKRINQLAAQIRELDDRQEEFDLKEQGSRSMQQAIALAHKGATIEELIESCDMSRGEAELLMMVHGPQAEN